MNKDIESRLKELRITGPSPDLRTKILSNARATWHEENEGAVLKIQFRQVLALAASIVLFIGVLVLLNFTEERNMRQTMAPYAEKNLQQSENVKFLEEMGLSPGYCAMIAGMSERPRLSSVLIQVQEELKL